MLLMSSDDTAEIAHEVREALLGERHGDIAVRDVQVSLGEDPFGTDAWMVRLWIDPPAGARWDVETTRSFRDTARRLMDEVAYRYHALPDGVTSVAVTAFEPDESDVAPPDRPEPGEDPAADEGEGEASA